MKTLFKILLGIAGTCIVGKVCYEIGRDVGYVENELDKSTAAKPDPKPEDDPVEYEVSTDDGQATPVDEEKTEDKPEEQPAKKVGFIDKLKELKNAAKFKDLLTKKDDSVLGKLLRDPDGTHISADVDNGEVHIKITPKKRE